MNCPIQPIFSADDTTIVTKCRRVYVGESDVIIAGDPAGVSTGGITWNPDGSFKFTTTPGGAAYTDEYDALHYVFQPKDAFSRVGLDYNGIVAAGGHCRIEWTLDFLDATLPANLRFKAMMAQTLVEPPAAITDFAALMWGVGYSVANSRCVRSTGPAGGSTSGLAAVNPDSFTGGPAAAISAGGGMMRIDDLSVHAFTAGVYSTITAGLSSVNPLLNGTTYNIPYSFFSVLREGALVGGDTVTCKLSYVAYVYKRSARNL